MFSKNYFLIISKFPSKGVLKINQNTGKEIKSINHYDVFNSILFAKYSRARGNQKYEIRFKTPIRKNHKKKKNKLLQNYLKQKLIYYKSPIGKGLIGKNKKDQVEIMTPSGVKNFEIVDVKYVEIEIS